MRKLLGPTVTIITLFGCLILAEISLVFFAPVPDPYMEYKQECILNQFIKSEFPPNYSAVTEVEEGLSGLKGPNVFSTDNMGFRGDYLVIPKPANEFRIFMVGGSTTECFYLDDSQAINAILQQYLQNHVSSELSIKVYNAGKSGDSSDDHISMLVHRIVHLEPDMIIVFSGINDLTRSIFNYDYLHYVKASREKYSTMLLFRFLMTEFQIPRRLYYALKKISPTDREILQEVPLKSRYKVLVKLQKSKPVSEEKPRADTKSYATNLKTIVGVAKAHNIRLIFMTQQTTWNSSVDPNAKNWHWMLYRGRGETSYHEEFMDKSLESLNEVMRQISREYSIPIYDLSKPLPKSLEFFYDDVHFNVKGASFVGKELGKYILQSGLIPYSLQLTTVPLRSTAATGAAR